MIHVASGNLLDSDAQTLVNTVNCVGAMGKGIALEFRKRFPAIAQTTWRSVGQVKSRSGVRTSTDPYSLHIS